MNKFLSKHKYKLVFIFIMALLLPILTSCRFDSNAWATKPYTSYAQEWIDLWNNGAGFFNALFAWPVNILSWPIAFICSNIGKGMGNSFFWGIFFTTLIVRTLAWPIYSKQNGMSLKMQLMQPEMQKIQAKYANRKDPRSQQMMQQEMMALYKKNKVNPLGCITTMFLQFPIFMSMYEVVRRINATSVVQTSGVVGVTVSGDFALHNTKMFGFFELNTSFFEATEISDKIFAVVIALIFAGLLFLQQKLSQRPMKYQKKYQVDKAKNGQANQMKWIMLAMNAMFVIMCLNSTSLAVYWLIGGVYQIFQTQVGRKINEINYERAQRKSNIISSKVDE